MLQSRTIVLKFGGASVSSAAAFADIADIILQRRSEYQNVIVVVSAMGKTTDGLISLAHQVNPHPPKRELDMLISTGERMSMSLLAMALSAKNVEAMSFTGSQSGILTTDNHSEAQIVDVKPKRLIACLEAGKIVIVAGFQGMSKSGEITTLGRGGSDTTAVALGIALEAEKVEFYKDVFGIYDKDPKKCADAKLYQHLNYEEAFNLMHNGAQVLHKRCILLAQKNMLKLHVLPFAKTDLHNQCQGTIVSGTEGNKPAGKIFEMEF